jgi:hypothetical protein
MLSVVKYVPKGYKLIAKINSDVNLFQNGTKFIGEISIPSLFGKKKYYLKLEGITSEYVKEHLKPPMGFSLNEFDEFDNHLIDLCISIVNILKNTEKYKGSAIHIMQPAYICTAFLGAALVIFMKQNNTIDPVLYVIAQTLQIMYGITQENAKKKLR